MIGTDAVRRSAHLSAIGRVQLSGGVIGRVQINGEVKLSRLRRQRVNLVEVCANQIVMELVRLQCGFHI